MQATYPKPVTGRVDSNASGCHAEARESFAEIYAQYEAAVFRYAYHLLGSRDDADDVKQETFLKAFQAIDSFRYESSLLTWLLKICANLCRDRNRSWDRRNVFSHAFLGDEALPLRRDTSDPAVLAERAELMETLHRSLGELPTIQREILLLHCVYDYRYDEIAEMLGCTRTGVKMRLFRARRALKASVAARLKLTLT